MNNPQQHPADPFPIAMIGVGGFGGYRRTMLRSSGRFRLVAAYDRDQRALAECVQEDHCVAADSYEALLKTPGIRGMVISTGAGAHAEQVLAALAQGLHVFVEKPLCTSPAEIRLLLAAQSRTGLAIGVGHKGLAGDAVAQTSKKLITSGALGTVVAIEATTAHTGGFHIKPGDWRGDPARNPGGFLFQCGVHKLHEMMWLFGPISEVSCFQRFDCNPDTQTADAALCILRFESGLLATLNAYHVTPYTHTLSIYGTNANLHRDERHFNEGTHLVLQRTQRNNDPEPQVAVPLEHVESGADSNLINWHDAIHGKADGRAQLLDGARAVAAVFAADESHRRGGSPVAIRSMMETLEAHSNLGT